MFGIFPGLLFVSAQDEIPLEIDLYIFLDFFCVFSDSKHAKRCLKSFKTKLRGEHWLILVISHTSLQGTLTAGDGQRRLTVGFFDYAKSMRGGPYGPATNPVRFKTTFETS